MDLRYTPEQQAFRTEVRAWLETHVPTEPLPHLPWPKAAGAW